MIAARRKLLFGLLAAPAIVRSASLMPLFVPPALILYGDGLHEDAKAVQFWFDGGRVVWRDRSKVGRHIPATGFASARPW